ncbi:4-hydroxy-tetrahydrodipicolinate reductase [Catalinimonas alkaloidigena]|uniref:4-hydroxy-tetrahydrodipicolinate reductase n=1 Tax=Catalinimonas alkaloidigena TaxID=1075417 RepID=A0A1G8XWH8_9BACT|nr:4-hydroxy-tetrahydrodipicolinate reductase [Catalinimonas alkaloidigena]SDJ94255.1 4-hydroxy-tetrahydrodipicolinate reductase [Catalinimonas alkaloidigena]
MNLILLGYGKMGKAIEQIALRRGHTIAARIDTAAERDQLPKGAGDVAIEFTQPDAAVDNIRYCLRNGIPVVSGTTGWLQHRPEIEQLCQEQQGAFFYASNYSIGVNLFFRLNRSLARLMNAYPEYQVEMEEIHHTQKKDAPSGTGITLAEGLMAELDRKTGWVEGPTNDPALIPILSKRIDPVPGTHTVAYRSAIDDIEIKHTAHSREGFATGAVVAAEWLLGKQGAFGMDDLLG